MLTNIDEDLIKPCGLRSVFSIYSVFVALSIVANIKMPAHESNGPEVFKNPISTSQN